MREDGLRARVARVYRGKAGVHRWFSRQPNHVRRTRRRRPDAGLIFHSDRGSEFQGTPVRTRLAASGVRQSMTRGGAPGENAHMESFFHSLKADVIRGRSFLMVADLRQRLRQYLRYYNYRRLHSSRGISRPLTMNVEPRRTSRVYGTEGRSWRDR
jgi:transposase InsO family protein